MQKEIASSIAQDPDTGKYHYIIHYVYDRQYTKLEVDDSDIIEVGTLVDSIQEAMDGANVVLDEMEMTHDTDYSSHKMSEDDVSQPDSRVEQYYPEGDECL